MYAKIEHDDAIDIDSRACLPGCPLQFPLAKRLFARRGNFQLSSRCIQQFSNRNHELIAWHFVLSELVLVQQTKE